MSVREGVPSGKVRITAAKAVHPRSVQHSQRLVEIVIPQGLGTVDEVYDELEYYVDVILGREDPPLDSPYLALQEIASAYLARAYEIEMLIHRAESDRTVTKGSPYYRLRTGSLRSFIEMARKMCDLGSRRLSQEQLITQQRRDIGEAW